LILDKVNFGLDLDSRVCLLGANGAGKSTLLKLIMGGDGAINPTDGWISRNPGLRMAMFTQHHVDQLDLRLTAIENLQRAFPKANLTGLQGEEACRRHLGRFGVSNSLATMPVICLSGGQKSRLAFAIITYRRPHVIIMDEPTNHLDLETIQALADAVQSFQGGIVIVTHDQSFIDAVATEIWVLGDGKVQVMRGGLDAYRKVVERQLRSSS
jgi:ATPase subunit of ABC transporter with duplicated ATPase domains